MANDFTQKQGIDFNETFSPISSKDSFGTIMDLEIHQMMSRSLFFKKLTDLEEQGSYTATGRLCEKEMTIGVQVEEIDSCIEANFKAAVCNV